jgi:hypothetical protein
MSMGPRDAEEGGGREVHKDEVRSRELILLVIRARRSMLITCSLPHPDHISEYVSSKIWKKRGYG